MNARHVRRAFALISAALFSASCDAVVSCAVSEALAPAAPVLLPLAMIADSMEDPDQAIQPVRVLSASNKLLAGPPDAPKAEEEFRLTRKTVTCTNINKGSQFGLSFAVDMACDNGRNANMTLGMSSHYRQASIFLRKRDAPTIRCFGKYEGNHWKGTVAPFSVTCLTGADIPYGTGTANFNLLEDRIIRYTLWVNPGQIATDQPPTAPKP